MGVELERGEWRGWERLYLGVVRADCVRGVIVRNMVVGVEGMRARSGMRRGCIILSRTSCWRGDNVLCESGDTIA